MTTNPQYEDEDLAFYALHLLPEAEREAIARDLSASEALRDRLAVVQSSLFAYAETVDQQAVPAGSLDRLMSRISQENHGATRRANARNLEAVRKPSTNAPQGIGLLPWIGWALAAGLALTTGVLYHRPHPLPQAAPQAQAVPPPAITAPPETAPVPAASAPDSDAADQTKRIEQLTQEAARARKDEDALRVVIAGQTAKLSDQAVAAENARIEQDRLRATLAAQAEQVSQLSGESGRSREVVDALTDRSALRVTLTRPKSRPAPLGRATYVANKGTLVFLASNLAPLRDDKVYQLWLMPSNGSSPVPAGTFVPDAHGNASVINGHLTGAVAAKGFSVTVEDQSGSQTPTLPIVLAGTAGA